MTGRYMLEGDPRVEEGQAFPVYNATHLTHHAPFVPSLRQHHRHALVGDAYEGGTGMLSGLDDSTEDH